jgi:hypothetical protein
VWAVLKQLLSTNWLNKSAVKREVSLVSFRNFWFCRVRTNGMTYVLSYPEFYDVCFAKFELLSSKWHESRHFSFVCDRFEDKQGISLTTWMVHGEIDKWNINFKFFCHFFLLFAILNGNWLKRYFAILTWANNSVCVDCFFLGICFSDEDL